MSREQAKSSELALPGATSEVRLEPPYLPDCLTFPDRIRAWMEVQDASEAMLQAGLRRNVASEEEFQTAYRAWHERHAAEHHSAMEQLCEEFNRRWREHV